MLIVDSKQFSRAGGERVNALKNGPNFMMSFMNCDKLDTQQLA